MKTIKLLLFVCTSFLVSCTSRTYEDISEQEVSTSPTYSANIEAVIKTNCTSCHSVGGQFPALTTYAQVKDATQNGNLICRIDQTQACGSVMPRSGAMPRQTIDMIILWQKEGYKN
ncbi:hypothetical protein [Flavobacterium eburneipallidum]|uniref:hypothetical protein n=1 Tax=Flavobacterium eburneipallidum TaxID=3003263 RepID=UPI0022AC75E9|nr:hypothetical protein [Flavobacterium eburneipallidum]